MNVNVVLKWVLVSMCVFILVTAWWVDPKGKEKTNAHRNQAIGLQWRYSFFFFLDRYSNIYANVYILQVAFLCFKFMLQISDL